jgi:hypothetical protein
MAMAMGTRGKSAMTFQLTSSFQSFGFFPLPMTPPFVACVAPAPQRPPSRRGQRDYHATAYCTYPSRRRLPRAVGQGRQLVDEPATS